MHYHFDEVNAIGGAKFDDGAGGDNNAQWTMLELINQLDGSILERYKGIHSYKSMSSKIRLKASFDTNGII